MESDSAPSSGAPLASGLSSGALSTGVCSGVLTGVGSGVGVVTDGVGEGVFRQWLEEAKTPEEVIERFRREGFNVGNNKAFMYARALTKGRVIIVSENVGKEELEKMMLGWAPNLQAALDMVCAEKKPRQVIVLPKAVSLIPKVVC